MAGGNGVGVPITASLMLILKPVNVSGKASEDKIKWEGNVKLGVWLGVQTYTNWRFSCLAQSLDIQLATYVLAGIAGLYTLFTCVCFLLAVCIW
jgi:hypothetical protein